VVAAPFPQLIMNTFIRQKGRFVQDKNQRKKKDGWTDINTKNKNKAIVDYTSPALCTPVIAFPAMRPIINLPEDDRATDIANVHKNLIKIACVVPEISLRTDTDRQTDISLLITKLRT